jgi:hypothetical protein
MSAKSGMTWMSGASSAHCTATDAIEPGRHLRDDDVDVPVAHRRHRPVELALAWPLAVPSRVPQGRSKAPLIQNMLSAASG